MAMLCVRVPDDLAARFDAAAATAGGRSAVLRRLIAGAAGQAPTGSGPPPRVPSTARLMVRLGAREAAHVAAQAEIMGLPRSGWVAALVRRHAFGEPCFSRAEELAVLAIRGEIRRIGVNVNQIARALNTAVLEGRVLELELSDLAALHGEMRGHMQALRQAFQGNLAYWQVEL